jgi:hypothetical protein
MPEVSFDTLEALDRLPVPSVAGTQVRGYRRFTVAKGPFKTEYNIYQQLAADDFAASDTFVSGLAHPFAVEVAWSNTDATEGGPPSATLEGIESESTFKTVTVHDADGVNGAGIVVKVHGF